MAGLAQRVVKDISHQVKRGNPPTLKSVCEQHDIDKNQIANLLDLFEDRWGGDTPDILATARNWLKSLRATPEMTRRYALLARDMLERPSTWRTTTMLDIARALAVPVDLLSSWYDRHAEIDWPRRPSLKRGWINREIEAAAEQGDINTLMAINVREEELLEMRQSLIDERLRDMADEDDHNAFSERAVRRARASTS